MNMMNPTSPPPPLTPFQGFALGWARFAEFQGRSSRMEYWSFTIINFFIQFLLSLFSFGILGILFFLVILIPSISIWMRRLHDIGRSGWWIFGTYASMAAIIWVVLTDKTESEAGVLIILVGMAMYLMPFIMCFKDGDPETNQYGPNPKLNPTNPSHPA